MDVNPLISSPRIFSAWTDFRRQNLTSKYTNIIGIPDISNDFKFKKNFDLYINIS